MKIAVCMNFIQSTVCILCTYWMWFANSTCSKKAQNERRNKHENKKQSLQTHSCWVTINYKIQKNRFLCEAINAHNLTIYDRRYPVTILFLFQCLGNGFFLKLDSNISTQLNHEYTDTSYACLITTGCLVAHTYVAMFHSLKLHIFSSILFHSILFVNSSYLKSFS